MGNLVLEILGEKMINQICEEVGLDEKAKNKAISVIEKWIVKRGLRETEERLESAREILKEDPCYGKIMLALIKVNAEFITQREKNIDNRNSPFLLSSL